MLGKGLGACLLGKGLGACFVWLVKVCHALLLYPKPSTLNPKPYNCVIQLLEASPEGSGLTLDTSPGTLKLGA